MQQLGVYKGSNHVIVTVLLFGASDVKSKTIAQALMRKADQSSKLVAPP